MSLHLHNTLGGAKQLFTPLQAGRVTLYVCGPTVYNLAHIGNARPAVVFDTLFRLLQTHYNEVVYARNITDIDDKIIAAAREQGRGIEDVTAEFTAKYQQDMAALNVLQPTLEPRATDHLPEMVALTETLLAKGHAYESAGHVLFAVQSMAGYGRLSNRSLDAMLAGARVEVADYKRHPGDFVLWKPSADSEPGWDSPWGRGRPGWHLECSAMIRAHLGETIDIHGGGQDLIFPHHENEMAQSCCAQGGDFVRYWLHNAHVDMDGEKMAKSLGNVRLVRDLLGEYPGEVLRFALLSAHYRSPLGFSTAVLEQARAALDSLYGALREVQDVALDVEVALEGEPFYAALNDDLNTPVAIAEMHALAKALNKTLQGIEVKGRISGEVWGKVLQGDVVDSNFLLDESSQNSGLSWERFLKLAALKARLLAAGDLLGVLGHDPEAWFQGDGIGAAAIEELIEARRQAKASGDYERADAIRQGLSEQGVALEDTRAGTTWRRVR